MAGIKTLGYRAGPGGIGVRPAIQGWGQGQAARQGFKGVIGVYPHFARAVRLLEKHAGRVRRGGGRGHIRRQGGHRGRDGQGQHTVHNGRRLLHALIAHGIVQQGVDKKPGPRSGLAGGDVRFQPGAGHLPHEVVDALVNGRDFAEGHGPHAVIDHLPPSRAVAPGLEHSGQSQYAFRHGRAAQAVLAAHPGNPHELPVLVDCQTVNTRQRLPVIDNN